MIDASTELIRADFGLTAFIVTFVLSALVSYLLRPKPPSDNMSPGEVDIPTCEQGTPYGIIFGMPPRFKSTMVLFHGGHSVYKWEDGDGAKGFYFYMAMHLGLAHGNIDGIKQIWSDDRCFWPVYNDRTIYNADSATTINISQFNAWGGKHGRGGLILYGTVLYGGSSQTQNATLMKYQDGADTPYYRGITSIVFTEQSYWSNVPNPPGLAVVLKRTALHHDGTAMWYVAKAVVDTYFSLNIIHVIRECLTSTTFGRGVSTARIDSTTFEAAADTLFTEKIGICYKYTPTASSMSDFLTKMEEIMDGVIYYDHGVGLYKIKLIRDDYVVGDLDSYDEDDFTVNTFSRQSYYLVPSETIVKYTDRDSAKQGIAKDDDLSIMRTQGESPVSQSFDWPMIVNPDTAVKLASREQDQASRIPAFLRLTANRSMYDIQRGDVFTISHPRLTAGGITSMTVRVVAIDRGELEDGKMSIDVTEEIFTTATAENSSPPSSESSAPSTTTTTIVSKTNSFSGNAASVVIINETMA